MKLATAREDTHPLDVIPIYEREVFSQIEAKKNATDRRAVELMSRVRRLTDSADQPHLFDDLLIRVRTEHKRKRNLMALLDSANWTHPRR